MPTRFINPAALAKPTGYTHVAIVAGGTSIHISGQVARDASGNTVGIGDVGAQARQVYANLRECLKAAGATFKDVVKLTTFVVDLAPDKAAAVRIARNECLGEPFPASTMVGVTALADPSFLVEVEMTAYIAAKKRPAAPKRKAAAKKKAVKRRR